MDYGNDDRNSSKDTRKSGGIRGGLKAAGKSLLSSSQDELDRAASERITPVQYRSGGRVRKTGPAIVHKNERVIPSGKRKKVERLMRNHGIRMKSRG